MEKVKGTATCKVCGRDFPLIKENRYVAREPQCEESICSIAAFDAFDCPFCGCQNLMQVRKPTICPCEYGFCGECVEQEEEENEST